MPIKAKVASLDGVDAAYHGLYVERNGAFELSVEIEGVEGVKSFTDFSKLTGGLTKERADHKALRDRYAPLGERKLEDAIAALDRLPELEAAAAGKLDEGKINGIVEQRITGKLAPVQRQLQQAQSALAERDVVINGYKQKELTRTVHDAVRSAVGASQGFQASAAEDVLMLAERVFEVDESGKVVTKDNVGVTPGIEPAVWLTEMAQKRPHWWGTSQGGGAAGNTAKGGSLQGGNPFTDANWNVTQQNVLIRNDRPKAEQLARSAGTSIGGRRPVKK